MDAATHAELWRSGTRSKRRQQQVGVDVGAVTDTAEVGLEQRAEVTSRGSSRWVCSRRGRRDRYSAAAARHTQQAEAAAGVDYGTRSKQRQQQVGVESTWAP